MPMSSRGVIKIGLSWAVALSLVAGATAKDMGLATVPSSEEISSDRGKEDLSGQRIFTFERPIDALSVNSDAETIDLEVGALLKTGWGEWHKLTRENEQDPGLHESNLVLFREKTTRVRIRGPNSRYRIHAIRVSDDPIRVRVAAKANVALGQRVVSRAEWGADEELLFRDSMTASPVDPESDKTPQSNDNGTSVSSREQHCLDAQKQYPSEFKVQTTTATKNGRIYKWPLQYSKSVRLLVIHHTAMKASGERRSGAERMRALYAYHSINRGWGDIGYNYVIDEDGKIYEGKAGGAAVVAGHAYCNNIGTVGVALMGNFNVEQPTQEQIKALQWLLDDLAEMYDIDLNSSVRYHGNVYSSPIVGHRNLLSTDCPGYYVAGVLDQIQTHVASGDADAAVTFPKPPERSSSSSSSRRSRSARPVTHAVSGLKAIGSRTLATNPKGRQRIMLEFVAPSQGTRPRLRLAQVKTSHRDINIWLENKSAPADPVRSVLVLRDRLGPYEVVNIPLIIQAPPDAGEYWLEIGGIHYNLNVSGRRARNISVRGSRSAGQGVSRRGIRSPASDVSSSSASRHSDTARSSPMIRILLTTSETPVISYNATTTTLVKNGTQCEGILDGKRISEPILTFTNENLISVYDGGKERIYRGSIECRIDSGRLILVNELPLEDYMKGLAEEPDTEPYEKQRAFAIAARSYARYYVEAKGALRKFPGKPYDGSDSPALFQVYAGVTFERGNPAWVRAVDNTKNVVLTVRHRAIKVPYFSSSDGRTRSPDEVGWSTFPNKHVFDSKPDPWCEGQPLRGHGVGMSGCGAEGQANGGKSGEEILQYYYPGVDIEAL